MARRLDGRDNIDGTIQLGSWVEGVTNNLPAKSVQNNGLTDAVNVDIDDKGKIKRRKGYSKIFNPQVGQKIYKMIGMPDGRLCVALNGFICVIEPNTGVVYQSNEVVGDDVCFLELNGEIYFSSKNASNSGILYKDSSFTDGYYIRDFGVPLVNSAPLIEIESGTLVAGVYQYCFTKFNHLGEESGTTQPQLIIIPDNSSIKFTFANYEPGKQRADGKGGINVYLSEANGETLYLNAKIYDNGSPFSSVVCNKSSTQGTSLKQKSSDKFPYVLNLAYCSGRIFGSDGNIVWYSNAYNYGLVDLESNYLLFSNEIKIMTAVQDGLYVADRMTYYVDCRNIEKGAERRTVLPYSGLIGSECFLENEFAVSWMSDKGVVLGYNGGEVKNMQDPKFIPNKAAGGAMLHRYQDGISQLLVTMFDEEANGAAVQDFAEAEIRRAGSF
jgi:hypothetical protein